MTSSRELRSYRDAVHPLSGRLDGRYLLWPTQRGVFFRLIVAGRPNPDNGEEYRVLLDSGELLVFVRGDRVLTRRYEVGHHPTEKGFVVGLISPYDAIKTAVSSYVERSADFDRPTTAEAVEAQLTETVRAAYRRGGGDPDAELFELPDTP